MTTTDRLYQMIESLPLERRVDILAAVWELCSDKPGYQLPVKEQSKDGE